MNSHRNLARVAIGIAMACLWAAPLRAQTNPVPAAEVSWFARLTGGAVSSPALSPDEASVYVATMSGFLYSFDTAFEGLDDTNAPLWRLRLGTPFASSPTISEDGIIYIAGKNGVLYSITDGGTNGVVNWRFRAQRSITGSPAISTDGETIYIGAHDKRLYAVRAADGTALWSFDAGDDIGSSPVVADDDTIYITAGSKLIGVSTDGAQTSSTDIGKYIHSTPAVGEDGILYFGAQDERVYAVDPAGSSSTNSFKWRFNTGKNVLSSPALGADGRVYIGSDSARLFALTTNGALAWSFRTRGPIRSAISIGADGTILFGADDRRLYAVNPETHTSKWGPLVTRGVIRSSPAISSEGIVYVTAGRFLYAVNDGATSEEAPWPMFARNAQHTARATSGEPFISGQPESVTVTNVSGTNHVTVSFTVVASAAVPVTYQWSFNGTNIDSEVNHTATNATLILTNVTAANAGVYMVTVANDFGEVDSEGAELIVRSEPLIISDLTNHFVSVGSIIRLEVNVAGEIGSGQWFSNGVPIAGANDTILTLSNGVAGSNAYFFAVTNAFGSTLSHTGLVVAFDISLQRSTNEAVAAGNRFSAAIVTNQLFTWGADNVGQLGDGGTQVRNVPTRTSSAFDWQTVSAGGRGFSQPSNTVAAHALALRNDGSLYAWGANGNGQLGNNSTNDQRAPVRIGSDTNWIQVEAGAAHSVGLKRDGTIWVWGANSFGQLGLGTTNGVQVPTQMGIDSAWLEVRAGGYYTLARRADGSLWAWGRNESGQLGIGSTNNAALPAQVGSNAVWKGVSAGVAHSLAVQTNGTVWWWGRNFGLTTIKVYDPTNIVTAPIQVAILTNVVLVDAGADHSLAIDAAGRLFSWGANNVGQLGNGHNGPTTGLTNSQNLVNPVQIGTARTWAQASAGTKHSVARATDGTIWAWGWNSAGQVGDGTGGDATENFNRNLPVQLVVTNFASVVTNQAPIITEQPVSLSGASGTNARFTVTAVGGGTLTYQWRFNSNNIPNETNFTILVTGVNATNQGFFDVVVTNVFGAVTSSVVSLTVSNAAPIITRQPTSRTTGTNGTAAFVVNAAGTQPLTFQWLKSDTIVITNATNSILVFTNTQPSDSGQYSVLVSNAFGSVLSEIARLTITNGNAGIPFPSGGKSLSAGTSDIPQLGHTLTVTTNGAAVPVLGNGTIYILEYKNRLEDEKWIPVSTNQGSGFTNLPDPAVPGPSRFYRLRIP